MVDLNRFPQGGEWVDAGRPGSDWLLVALHGSNGSAENFRGLEEIFEIPDLNYLYLNGPIPSFSHYRWYDSPDSRHDAIALLTEVFDYLAQQGYPPERTFLLGFSQGAALTFEFGSRYPHSLAGYISISGRIEGLRSMLNQCDPRIVKRGRWLVTHGTGDFNLSAAIMHQQVEQLRDAGFRIEYREFDKIHEFDAKEELPFIRDWIMDHMS